MRGGEVETKKNLSQEDEIYADDADFTQEKSIEPKNQEQEYDAKK